MRKITMSAEPEVIVVDGTWVGVSQAVLVIVALCYGALGLVSMSMFLLPLIDPNDMELLAVSVLYGVLLAGVCLVMVVVNLLVAFGLGRQWLIAWVGGVVLGGIYLMSLCMPFGAILLYALVAHEETRGLYLAKR